ncbi:MAG: zinc ribbon domain-containing protein [Candidatus Scalindua sp.]|nr:zinc ribbon domain-containing protein [Candidatus Scalindua sp.]MCR4344217.1 zinc ribbon domain-containing protein [Candidatus Scalindua sp.]
MPTYDYECNACNHTMELFQSITAKHIRKCPECGKLKLKRRIGTGSTIIFKGSGFYQTDYRSEGYKTQEKAEKESSTADKKDSKDKKDSNSGKNKKKEVKENAKD